MAERVSDLTPPLLKRLSELRPSSLSRQHPDLSQQKEEQWRRRRSVKAETFTSLQAVRGPFQSRKEVCGSRGRAHRRLENQILSPTSNHSAHVSLCLPPNAARTRRGAAAFKSGCFSTHKNQPFYSRRPRFKTTNSVVLQETY